MLSRYKDNVLLLEAVADDEVDYDKLNHKDKRLIVESINGRIRSKEETSIIYDELMKDYLTLSHYLSGKEYDANIKETVDRLVLLEILAVERTEDNIKDAMKRLKTDARSCKEGLDIARMDIVDFIRRVLIRSGSISSGMF